MAGEISGLAYAHGHRRERVKAQAWRDAFVGRAPAAIKIPGLKAKRDATDHMLAKVIPILVSGCEAFGAGSHRYDAVGVALWATRVVLEPVGMVAEGEGGAMTRRSLSELEVFATIRAVRKCHV